MHSFTLAHSYDAFPSMLINSSVSLANSSGQGKKPARTGKETGQRCTRKPSRSTSRVRGLSKSEAPGPSLTVCFCHDKPATGHTINERGLNVRARFANDEVASMVQVLPESLRPSSSLGYQGNAGSSKTEGKRTKQQLRAITLVISNFDRLVHVLVRDDVISDDIVLTLD